VRWDVFARHREETVFLGLGMGVLVGVAFCAFEVGVEDGNWTGADRDMKEAYKGCIKIGNWTGIHKIRLYCTKRV